MKFSVNTKTFSQQLGFVNLAKDEREAVGIVAKDGLVILYSTNGDEELLSSFPAEIKEEGFAIVNNKIVRQVASFPDENVNVLKTKRRLTVKKGKRSHFSSLLDPSVFYPKALAPIGDDSELDDRFMSDLILAAKSAKRGETGTYYGYVHVAEKGWIIGSTMDYSTIVKRDSDMGIMNFPEGSVSKYFRHLGKVVRFLKDDKLYCFFSIEDDVTRRVCLSQVPINYSTKAYDIFDKLAHNGQEFSEYFTKVLVDSKELKRVLSVCRMYSDNINKYADLIVHLDGVYIKIDDDVSAVNEVVEHKSIELKSDGEKFQIDISQLANAIHGLSGDIEIYLLGNAPMVVVSDNFNYIQAPAKARAIEPGE